MSSSFHPLGPAADSHPLTPPAELPFHNDDEDGESWTPPSLPGDPDISSSVTRGGRHGGRKYGVSSTSNTSPLDVPLDPLLHSLPTDATDDTPFGEDDLHHRPRADELPRTGAERNSHAKRAFESQGAWGAETAAAGRPAAINSGRSGGGHDSGSLSAGRASGMMGGGEGGFARLGQGGREAT